MEFDGRAEPSADQGAFEAPFSGESALCCQVWMETKDRYRTNVEGLEVGNSKEPADYQNTESSWQLAETGEIRRPFVVQDGGARVAVEPDGADLDVTGHMGETVLAVDDGESVPDEVEARLEALEGADEDFDGAVRTWDDPEQRVQYREARLEPGDAVHVTGSAVDDVPDEWGADVDATVAASDGDDRFLISEGTESDVVRKHLVQFATGVPIGLVLLAVGLRAAGIGPM